MSIRVLGRRPRLLQLMLSLQEDARNRTNAHNARMLGYHHTLSRLPTFYGNLVCPDREDLIAELEDDRYFVILAAYDIQAAQKDRQPKLLWITRFSLRTRGNDFDRSINGMAHAASFYFGRASDGLRREQLREGSAVPGELEVIESEEPKKSSRPVAPFPRLRSAAGLHRAEEAWLSVTHGPALMVQFHYVR